MAVGMLMQIPGGTQDFYDGVMEALDWEASDRPAGFIAHYAGPDQNGWTVFDVWESEADFYRFAEERLKPAMQKVRGEVPPLEPQFIQIYNEDRVPVRA